ncbi:MAG: class II glutamine amidotransferase [Candidatus Saccharicenans sp.]|nr:class II glutamine amidotransferase [Candidatus Saccharicenans sp.]
MCRLLGLIANQSVDLEFSLDKFKKYSSLNQDGWGIGWYENGSARIYKEALSAWVDPGYNQKSREVQSKIIIAHVRAATTGKRARANSHPFMKDNWIFAHNGLVPREHLIKLLTAAHKKDLEGQTDSEVYFRWILQCLDKNGEVVKGISQAVGEIIGKTHSNCYHGLNFLLSDGQRLYALRFSNPGSLAYYSLYYLLRDPKVDGPSEFASEETKIILRSKSLKGQRAILVCSEKLTEENWQEIKPGYLLEVGPDLRVQENLVIK